MTTTTTDTAKFAEQCQDRLIDSYELMQMLGVRARETIWKRVEAGTLPAPVIRKGNFALWDRETIPTEGGTT